jgi:hypothetical protein
MKSRSAICLCLAIVFSMNGCGSTARWGEEVQLSDGRVIVVERQTVFEPGGGEWAQNRSGVTPKEYVIRLAALDGSGQTVEWKSATPSPGTVPELPLILDVEAGQPVVFTIGSTKTECEAYLKYRYQDRTWTEQPLPDQFDQRTTNLLLGNGIDKPKFVSLQDKRIANADASYRAVVKHVGPNRKICG